MEEENPMVKEKTWEEFRQSGLLWWINSLLHVFGWAIVITILDDGKISSVYPARVKFRGFNSESNDKGYQNISKYMVENAPELLKESQE